MRLFKAISAVLLQLGVMGPPGFEPGSRGPKPRILAKLNYGPALKTVFVIQSAKAVSYKVFLSLPQRSEA